MRMPRVTTLVSCAAGFALAGALVARALPAQVVIDFEDVPLGSTTPFWHTVGTQQLVFGGTGAGQAFHVVDASTWSTAGFAGLTGHILAASDAAQRELPIAFGPSIGFVTMHFALGAPAGSLTVTGFWGGSLIGSTTVAGVVPDGFTLAEGSITFTGRAFQGVIVSSSTSDFAIDHVVAYPLLSEEPEPATIALVATGLLALGPSLAFRRSRHGRKLDPPTRRRAQRLPL